MRLNIDRHNFRWCIKHEKDGKLVNTISFSTKLHNHEEAKCLLLIARQEAEKTGWMPSRDTLLELYETSKLNQPSAAIEHYGDINRVSFLFL